MQPRLLWIRVGHYCGTGTNAYTRQHQCIYQPALVVCRQAITDVIIGSSATPADNATQWALMRTTVAPTGGAVITPSPADSQDGATNTLDMSKPTGASTLACSALLVDESCVTFRWWPSLAAN